MAATRERGHEGPKSLYRGVYWHKMTSQWCAGYRGKHLGSFKTQEEALMAYVAAGGTPAPKRLQPKSIRHKDAAPLPLRMLKDCAREGQWIVWGVGPFGECELVNIDRCTCEAFQKDGHCRHYDFVFATEGQEAA